MVKKYFGTDGIRDKSNTGNMTASVALKVGMAVGKYYKNGEHRHIALIGKDPRLSGYMIEQALTAGFLSMGMDVVLAGPMPTPAISMLTRAMRCDVGVMISASHNSYDDNGIKLFAPDGDKLSDEQELEIEKLIDEISDADLPPSCEIGRAKRIEDVEGRYIEYVKQSFPKNLTLKGLRIVIDCANGAAYKVAPKILYELGAEVFPIGVEPNGININNNVGSTAPKTMVEAVLQFRADIGIALDGDADRLIVSNELGEIVDGDKLLATIAMALKAENKLKNNTIAATVMSNLALQEYLTANGIKLLRTDVGDRYVYQAMKDNSLNLGGEQSGHIILSDYATTGDGILAALKILEVMVKDNKKCSEVTNLFEPLPQLLAGVRYNKSSNPLEDKDLQEFLSEKCDFMIKNHGRILVRKSGTEPLIRVMIEARDKNLANKTCTEICDKIQAWSK